MSDKPSMRSALPDAVDNIARAESRARTDSAIKSGRSTAANTILAQNVDGALFDDFVTSETGEIVAREVGDLFSAGKFRLGTVRTDDDGDRSKFILLLGSERGAQRLWSPLVHKLVDFL